MKIPEKKEPEKLIFPPKIRGEKRIPCRQEAAVFALGKYYDAEGQYYELSGKPAKAIPFYLKSFNLFYTNNYFIVDDSLLFLFLIFFTKMTQ